MYDYHDATLKTATVDWENGVTVMTFALCVEPARQVAITIRETSEFIYARQFPWGKSVSVNRLDVQIVESGHRVTVEMQSGDKIVATGREVLEKTAD